MVFAESNVRAQVTTLSTPSFDISGEYTFRSGQELTYYDQGLIKRKPEFDPASRRLKVYFSNGFYESTDDGDLTTVNSYDEFNYARDLSGPGGLSVSDIIDIRPRVSDYTISEDSRSPLEFKGRTFDGSGNSAGNILASDEDLTTTFSTIKEELIGFSLQRMVLSKSNMELPQTNQKNLGLSMML